jgi:hypothetical protein
MTVPGTVGFCAFCLWLVVGPLSIAHPQDPPEKKQEETKPETFFAGTVVETTSGSITVSRVVLGKTEKRVFRVTPDTKCEGKLKPKVRVTIRYVVTEEGETAELIVVRSQQPKKKQQ